MRHVGRVRVENRSLGPMTLAVAPALNVSGSADFDPNRFADAMAVELGYVDGGPRSVPFSSSCGFAGCAHSILIVHSFAFTEANPQNRSILSLVRFGFSGEVTSVELMELKPLPPHVRIGEKVSLPKLRVKGKIPAASPELRIKERIPAPRPELSAEPR